MLVAERVIYLELEYSTTSFSMEWLFKVEML